MSLDVRSLVDMGTLSERDGIATALADAVPILIAYIDRDGRYRFVNQAHQALFGKPPSQIEGRLFSEMVGDATYARIRPFIERTLNGETQLFDGELTYDMAGLRHVEARFQPQFDDDGVVKGFYLLVTDLSARKSGDQELSLLLQRERRRVALLDLRHDLRGESDPAVLAQRASVVVARHLGAPRAGYAQVDAAGLVLIAGECTAEGFPSLVGQLRELDSYGRQMSADLRAGDALVIADITQDPRTNSPQALDAFGALRTASVLTSPLIKDQRIAAYIYINHDTPRAWTADEVAFVNDVAEVVWAAGERARSDVALKRAETTERLLIREVDHRAKNVLAVVQAMAQLTPFVDKRQYVEALGGRIGSLARSHSQLSSNRWIGVRLETLLRQELEPYGFGGGDQVTLDGPPVLIQAEATQSLGLVVHELATNAGKYGALAQVDGALSVSWGWDLDRNLVLTWRETRADPLEPPSHKGFGSTLIAKAIRQLSAALTQDWRADGLTCRLTLATGALACDPDTSAPILFSANTAPGGAHALQGQRVLIVEDEILVATELGRSLTQAGAVVIGPAGTIEEALDFVASTPIDRAVLDVNLRGRMVTPVTRALAEKSIPFVYLTGYQDPGVDDGPILRKPASIELLLGALAHGTSN